MWKCEKCNSEFDDETMAVEVRFGYLDSGEADQYMAFETETAWAPLCDKCAIAYTREG